jgi:hypothetical protein
MAILKNTFTAGRMNKDLDERLIPKGEYRHAYNIEVSTTNGGDAGSVQNIRGNKFVGSTETYQRSDSNCVGSVVDEKNDNCYFFFASDGVNTKDLKNFSDDNDGYVEYVDYIVEQNVSGLTKHVVVDKWGLLVNSNKITAPTYYFNKLEVDDIDKYQVGMDIVAFKTNGGYHPLNGTKIIGIDGDYIVLSKLFQLPEWDGPAVGHDLACLMLTKPKALDLEPGKYITGANVIDGYLLWTTDYSEPRKINIERCKKGTPTRDTQTALYVNVNGKLVLAGEDEEKSFKKNLLENSDFSDGSKHWEIENVTISSSSMTLSSNSSIIYKPRFYKPLNEQDISVVEYGKTYTIKINIITNYQLGSQTLKLSSTSIDVAGYGVYGTFDTGSIGVKTLTFTALSSVIRISSDLGGIVISSIELSEVSKDLAIPLKKDHTTLIRNITAFNNNWVAELDFASNNIFENQFVRFATRYIYSGGEYSTFSPWSEPVFQPGSLDYNPREGYNLGMVNRVKEILLKDLVPRIGFRPDDVVAVDVLFKSSDSNSVYVVKTISRDIDGEWLTGEMLVNNEMIHEVVPSDQITRSWDNVPKTAKAQEIIGNRLVLANYTQGYDMSFKPSVSQYLKSENLASVDLPEKSIKSMRSYKVGVVYG